jgi:hypothetical protein
MLGHAQVRACEPQPPGLAAGDDDGLAHPILRRGPGQPADHVAVAAHPGGVIGRADGPPAEPLELGEPARVQRPRRGSHRQPPATVAVGAISAGSIVPPLRGSMSTTASPDTVPVRMASTPPGTLASIAASRAVLVVAA